MKKKKFFIGVIGSLSVFMINPNSRLITKTKTIPIEQNFKKATFNQSDVEPITTFLATKEAYADSSLSNKAFSDWVDSVPSGLIAEIKKTSIYINSFNKWKLRQDSGHGNPLYKDTEAFVNNSSISNDYFNAWKTTAKGQEVLKKYYEKWKTKHFADFKSTPGATKAAYEATNTGDTSYTTKFNAYKSGHSANTKEKYADLAASTTNYNTWRVKRETGLKNAWEATTTGATGFVTKVNSWMTANRPALDTKAEWLANAASTTAFNTWKNALSTEAQRKTIWEDSDDFKTKSLAATSSATYLTNNKVNFDNYIKRFFSTTDNNRFNINIRLASSANASFNIVNSHRWYVLLQFLLEVRSGHYEPDPSTKWNNFRFNAQQRTEYFAQWNNVLNDKDTNADLRTDVLRLFDVLHAHSNDGNYVAYAKAQYKLPANSATYNTNFNTWNTDANLRTYYNTHAQSDTDYLAYKKTTYKANAGATYNTDLDAWSATKANGLAAYKLSADLIRDYATWIEAQYKASDAYNNDYEAWIKNQWETTRPYRTFDAWTGHKTNWKPAYMHKNVWNLPSQADKDRITWLKEEYEKTDDFKALIKTHYGTKAKALAFYKKSIQLQIDYAKYGVDYNANVDKWHELKPGMNNTHLASYDDYKRNPQAWLERYIDGYKKDDFLNDYATTDLFTQSEIDALKSKIAGLDELEKSKAIFTFFKNQVAKVKAKVDQNKKVTFDQWLQNNGHTLDDWIAANKDKIVAYWKTQTSAFNASYNKYVQKKVAADGTSLSKRDIKTWAFNTAEGRTFFGNWIKSKVLNDDYANVYKKYMQVRSGNYKAFSQVHLSEEEAWNHIKKVYPWFAKFAIGMADHNAGVLATAKDNTGARTPSEWLSNNMHYFDDWKRSYTYDGESGKRANYWRTSSFYKNELSRYMENGPDSILNGKRTLEDYAKHSSNSDMFASWKRGVELRQYKYLYYHSTSSFKNALRERYSYNDWLEHIDGKYDRWFLSRLGHEGIRTFEDFTFKTSQTGTPDKYKTIKKGTATKEALYQIIKNVEKGSYGRTLTDIEVRDYSFYGDKDSNYYKKWEAMLADKDLADKANLKDTLVRFLKLQNTGKGTTYLNTDYLDWAYNKWVDSGEFALAYRAWDSNIESYFPWYLKWKTLNNYYNNFKKTNFESNSTPNTYKNEFSDWTNRQATYLTGKTRPHALGEGYSKWFSLLKNKYNANEFKAHWQKNLANMDAAKAKWYYDITLKMYNKDHPTQVPDFLKSKEALSAYGKWKDPSIVSISRDQYVASSQGVKDYNSFVAANRSSLETLWKADYQANYDKYLDDNDKLYEKVKKAKSIADKVWFARNQFKATDDYIKQLKLDLEILSHKELADRIKKTYVYYLKETLKTK